MTGPEFRKALEALGTKPGAFAAYLGVNRATVFRWLDDGPPVYAQRVVELRTRLLSLAEAAAA